LTGDDDTLGAGAVLGTNGVGAVGNSADDPGGAVATAPTPDVFGMGASSEDVPPQATSKAAARPAAPK